MYVHTRYFIRTSKDIIKKKKNTIKNAFFVRHILHLTWIFRNTWMPRGRSSTVFIAIRHSYNIVLNDDRYYPARRFSYSEPERCECISFNKCFFLVFFYLCNRILHYRWYSAIFTHVIIIFLWTIPSWSIRWRSGYF